MSPEEFATLRDFIGERTGIHVRDNRVDYLHARVDERAKARRLAGPRDYYYFLKYGPEGPAELQALVDLLTVQETSFFRSPEQLDVLAAELPALLAAFTSGGPLRGELAPRSELAPSSHSPRPPALRPGGAGPSLNGRSRPFRAWSAGCATGEEPATLAMLLAERVPAPLEILATDISSRALAAATTGRFPLHRLRDLPEALRARHFRAEGTDARLSPALGSLIEYRHLNLADPAAFAAVPEQDLILCRNVFIYLSEAAKLAVAQAFYRVLAPWGLVLMGAAETIDIARVPFQIKSVRGGLIYQKG